MSQAGSLNNNGGGGGTPITTLNGDTGSATGASILLYANNAAKNSGSSVLFVNSGSTSTLNVTVPILLNTFIGANAGTLTASGTENTSVGSTSLGSLTSGTFNTAFGSRAMQSMQGGISNTAVGLASMFANVSGQDNAAFGDTSLLNNTSNFNTAIGSKSLTGTGAGGGELNTCVGYGSGNKLDTSSNCTFVGALAGGNLTGGTLNDSFGYNSLIQLLTGSYNICIGSGSGDALTSSESSNVYLNNSGVAAESNTIRIGRQGAGPQQQNTCYVAGIAGVTTANSQTVTIDSSTGQLGSQAIYAPNSSVSLFDDFFSFNVSSQLNGSLTWYMGSTSAWLQSNTTAETNHPGVVGNSSFASGAFALMLASSTGTSSNFKPGGGAITLNWIFKINTLSNGTNSYNLALGMGQVISSATQTSGAWFQYNDTLNSGNWTFNTSLSSFATNQNSAVAATVGWHNAQIVINANCTLVSFYMDGVLLGTSATNLPSTFCAPILVVQRLAGTIAINTITVDLFTLSQVLTTTR